MPVPSTPNPAQQQPPADDLPGLLRDQAELAAGAAPPEPEPVEAEAADRTSETSGDDAPTFEAPFSLEDVDPAYRDDVARYVKQTQGAFTRSTQELAKMRAELNDLKAIYDRLESDDERVPALRELLGRYGYELDDDQDEAQAYTGALDQEPGGVEALQARIDKLEGDAQQREQQSYVERMRDHVEEGLFAYAEEAGYGEDLPEAVQDALMAHMRSLPPVVIDGQQMPDVKGAIIRYEAVKATELQAYLQSKRAPAVNAGGSSGEPKYDATDPEARRKRALEIAGRELG